MTAQERCYRVLLVAHPRRHRQEYGEAMVQLMRDRLRDEGGGLRTWVVWVSLLTDLASSASVERAAVVRVEFRTGWWRAASVVVAAVLATVAVRALLEPATGPWYKYTFARAALVAAPVAVVAGLVVRQRHRRRGSWLVAIGVLPGVTATVLFWFPPALLFGLFSIAAMAGAIEDAENARRPAIVGVRPSAPGSARADWAPPQPGGHQQRGST